MLDGSADMMLLYTFDKSCSSFTGQIRILRIIFKVAAAKGGAFDIDSRSKNYRYIVSLCFFTYGITEIFHQFSVERAGRQYRRRKADRFNTFVNTEMISFFILLTQSMRAITDHHAGDTQTIHSLGMPEIKSGTKPGFLF